jgi:hypothetical protein
MTMGDYKETNEQILKMIKGGIPVERVRFHQPISNGYGEPESHLTVDNSKLQRKADMWLTPNLLIFLQNSRYIAVPFANIIEVRFV